MPSQGGYQPPPVPLWVRDRLNDRKARAWPRDPAPRGTAPRATGAESVTQPGRPRMGERYYIWRCPVEDCRNCKAFELWFQAIAQMQKERPEQFEQDQTWGRALDARMALGIAIRKSNLLYRLIYLGERLRTEPCPEHKGRWSGYGWGRICACQDYEHGGYGPDLTGWLPRRDEVPDA
jgi:hypothetical protein